MATTQSIKNQLQNQNQAQTPVKRENSVKGLLNSPTIQNKFKDLLKDKASGFTSSLLTLVNSDSYLADSQPMSIIAGAMQAAQLDLPLEKQFGFAYLVPFNSKEGNQWVKKAQFVLGYRGYIQLAQRSGQYKTINVGNVYEGQLKSWNPFTEELEFDPEAKSSDNVIGYFGYFKLLNGFEKTVYWTTEEVRQHRKENAKGKDKQNPFTGIWKDNFDAMAQKTVLRNLLSKWGILSIEMQRAVMSDEAVAEDLSDDNEPMFKDVTPESDGTEFDPAQEIDNIEVNENGEIVEAEPQPLFDEPYKSKLDK